MAEECAADALALDPANSAASALLVRSVLRQRAEADALASHGGSAPDSLNGARDVAKIYGFGTLSQALGDALNAADYDVAVACCDLYPDVYGNEDLGGNPLGAALESPEARVRYAAAIAALRMSPSSPFTNADKVATLAAQAAASGAVRQVLVIDDHADSRSKLVMALDQAGFVAGGSRQGFVGANRAKMSPTMDVIVVRANLGNGPDTLTGQRHDSSMLVIDDLTRDARTKNMRVVLLLDEGSEAADAAVKEVFAQKYGDKIHGYLQRPITDTVTASTVDAAAKAGDLAPDGERANALAARAAGAFADADLSCGLFDASSAVGPLASAVESGSTPDIKKNAIRALGNLRAGGTAALTKALTEGEDEHKALAATALGSVLAVQASDEAAVKALMDAAGGEGDVATAALKALGQVRDLTPAQRLEVFKRHRLQVSSKAD